MAIKRTLTAFSSSDFRQELDVLTVRSTPAERPAMVLVGNYSFPATAPRLRHHAVTRATVEKSDHKTNVDGSGTETKPPTPMEKSSVLAT